MIKIPINLEKERPQTKGEYKDVSFEVYYDHEATCLSAENQYAVFSEKGFHGWLDFGFTNPELYSLLDVVPTESYEKEFEQYYKK